MTGTEDREIAEVTRFWRDAGPDAWFEKNAAFDDRFRTTLGLLHWRAARRELDYWNASPDGALALMILLDQFPRNCFRNTGHMYATDPLARHHARQAIEASFDQGVEQEIRHFFYLPFIHSEDLSDQEYGVELFTPLGEETLKHAVGHRNIVKQFGRFPHRNPILARESTADELKFLSDGGFAG